MRDLTIDFSDVFDLLDGLVRDSTKRIEVEQNNRKEFVFEAELPGVKKADIKVKTKGRYLIVEALRKGTKIIRKAYVLEDFDLPKTKAKYEDGLLTLTVPRKEPIQEIDSSIKID